MFLGEFEDIAMAMTVSYDWADDHDLLAELYEYQKYFTLTGKRYVPPNRLPVIHQSIVSGDLNQNNAIILKAENNQARVNYAILRGFWSGS